MADEFEDNNVDPVNFHISETEEWILNGDWYYVPESTNVTAIRYLIELDETQPSELQIEFHGGRRYYYIGVGEYDASELHRTAMRTVGRGPGPHSIDRSTGKFINWNIKTANPFLRRSLRE